MNNFDNKILPCLYINITEKCNMKCEYCPTYGENWESTEGLLELDTVLDVISAAHNAGVVSYRISGGEPMIFPLRVFAILDKLNSLGINDIILNTNGFNTFKYVDRLKKYEINKVKVSIDTLDRSLFKEITNLDKIDDVLNSINSLRSNNIPLELNMVVFQKNASSFWEILEFCVERGISLKLLDLVFYEILVRNDEEPIEYWRREYFNLANYVPRLTERFGEPRLVRLSNDRGIPMYEFKIGKAATLTLKDGTLGSTYADICRKCDHFPCQEGLFHLSLSAEGSLTPCRLRRDLTVSMKEKSFIEIENIVENTIPAYQNPFFVKETVEFPS
ncbi:MAG: radical SAM protein [Pyrinomonadaceae bacterium]